MIMSMRIPDAIYERLNSLAEQTGRPKSYYIKEALIEKISDLELLYLAKQRSEDMHAGRTRTYSWEEVKAENSL